ncbi:sensor histidine kinase [Amycolatopsis sp. NPDC049868]|uniref:sensor histidine kinase n=1 Tax=Amycolatopsis sp. NPDC049868 TaxID=3363934 RepID=UPI0037B32AA6
MIDRKLLERPTLLVAAVAAGVPLSLLALRSGVLAAFPELNGKLAAAPGILPLLVLPVALQIWAAVRRLHQGMPHWRWTVPVLTLQFLLTVPMTIIIGRDGTLTLIFACTVLVTLPRPWSFLGFGSIVTIDLISQWAGVVPAPAIGALVLHKALAGLLGYTVLRMAETTTELRRTQAQLAALAVAQERSRVSRDLHDTLGQELTAIGLRVELAARVAGSDQARALGELRGVQQLTERAARNVRKVARGELRPVFADELATGTALLEAGGVACRVAIDAEPDNRIGQVVGWALREGVTNVLNHSAARQCWLSTEIHDDRFRLTVENNGACERPGPAGTGLAGITQRVADLGGRVNFGHDAAKNFRLVVEIPIEDDDDQACGGRGHAGTTRSTRRPAVT